MLDKVEVRTDLGTLLTLPMLDISEGYLIDSIGGLDPVPATIVSSQFAQQDGEQYQASRREKRNIVIKLKLEPDYALTTVGELRDRLYGFFMPKANVNLRFYRFGAPTVDISGYVETFDAPLFAKEPSATISIVNLKPDFIGLDPVLVNGNTTSTTVETPVTYGGSIEAGFKFRLLVNRTIDAFDIYHRMSDSSVRILEFESSLLNGDVLEINTPVGGKGATLTRGGSTSSILWGVAPSSTWINLFPGVNNIRVFAAGTPIPYTIEYTPRYGGL